MKFIYNPKLTWLDVRLCKIFGLDSFRRFCQPEGTHRIELLKTPLFQEIYDK